MNENPIVWPVNENRIAWCARPSELQHGTAKVVAEVIGGTLFFGMDGSILVMSTDAAVLVSIDKDGRTMSAHVEVDQSDYKPAWTKGYTA